VTRVKTSGLHGRGRQGLEDYHRRLLLLDPPLHLGRRHGHTTPLAAPGPVPTRRTTTSMDDSACGGAAPRLLLARDGGHLRAHVAHRHRRRGTEPLRRWGAGRRSAHRRQGRGLGRQLGHHAAAAGGRVVVVAGRGAALRRRGGLRRDAALTAVGGGAAGFLANIGSERGIRRVLQVLYRTKRQPN
jgi:hypothetical protein